VTAKRHCRSLSEIASDAGGHLPAVGRGIQDSGVTVFEAGPHDFDERNFAELCDYLAS
jgi:hypothetical protein